MNTEIVLIPSRTKYARLLVGLFYSVRVDTMR